MNTVDPYPALQSRDSIFQKSYASELYNKYPDFKGWTFNKLNHLSIKDDAVFFGTEPLTYIAEMCKRANRDFAHERDEYNRKVRDWIDRNPEAYKEMCEKRELKSQMRKRMKEANAWYRICTYPKPDSAVCGQCLTPIHTGANVAVLRSCQHFMHADCFGKWRDMDGECTVCEKSTMRALRYERRLRLKESQFHEGQ